MGLPDSSLLDLIEKVKSWISWGNSYSNCISLGFEMENTNCNMCFHCDKNILESSCLKYQCQSCGRVLCGNCVQGLACLDMVTGTEAIRFINSCKLCFELGPVSSKSFRKDSGKVYPSKSPRQSPEPPSSSSSGLTKSNDASPMSVRRSLSRSDEDEGEESSSYFFGTSSEYFQETSDVDSSSVVSARHDFYSFTSIASSPSETPRSQNNGQEQALLEKPANGRIQVTSEKVPQLLDFENNSLIWFPPPPDGLDADVENFFTYDDDDDDDSDTVFSSSGYKEPMRAVVHGHFRALVSQLLQGHGVKENCDEWLDTVTAIAWQAANFIKPDTSKGGSMDPCNYIKVKCVASGSPKDSKLIKGVVCTKNIKHKRMTSQYKNPRLLLLGGALEYQRVPNQLASFNTLLQQENDHLKTIISKIESHRPNVLLVEKSVSSFAQEQLLAKEISLVLNVKRPLLEMIARCTGAIITPSTDHLSTTRLGQCELFHVEKFSENHEPVTKKPSKTLMFIEGCPRRLGCTVVLRGSNREELKKVKEVLQYAVFAAYHLSLETSFLADEGARLPKTSERSSHPQSTAFDKDVNDLPNIDIEGSTDLSLELGLQESLSELCQAGYDDISISDDFRYEKALLEACDVNLSANPNLTKSVGFPEEESSEFSEASVPLREVTDDEASAEYYTDDGHQSILVSFSSHCMLSETLCERSRLIRVKFYGPSDKPLGRYLRDDLFDQSSFCRSCKESAEAHVVCYTHRHGNLTINVKRLPSVMLPGEQDGKIWMWHRCLRCAQIEGIPPATRRVVMSDAAWGLSFGKFLELSFSNHATGNRVASCGHSLQRDCLRFYGFGSVVASFRYSPVNILSVQLPPSVLEFSSLGEQSWIRKEAAELSRKSDSLYADISGALLEIKQKSLSSVHEFSDASDLHNHVLELLDTLAKEQNYCNDLLVISEPAVDILQINHLRNSLITGLQVWERRLGLLDSLLKNIPSPIAADNSAIAPLKSNTFSRSCSFDHGHEEEHNLPSIESACLRGGEMIQDEENVGDNTSLERLPSAASMLSDKIDSSWSGADNSSEAIPFSQVNITENPSIRKLISPTRVFSFDSAVSFQEKIRKELPRLSMLHSFHASGDYKYMVRDPVSLVRKTYSQVSPRESDKLNPSGRFISPINLLPEGARMIAPKNGVMNDVIVIVYENEPATVISYALSSKDYEDQIADRLSGSEAVSTTNLISKVNSQVSSLSTWHSFGSLDLDYMQYGNYGSEDAFAAQKTSAHLRISFEDESSNGGGKVKFLVTCYFAKQFDALRKRCCPGEVDFVRSLSRCMKWNAQGGKSNVYFARSLDERFIIKQVTKTELESFGEFAPEYFKYLTDSLGSLTCLAKILGIYQVVVKHSKGGKEIKMDLMVMENLFYKRKITKVYDLKGSARSRYNSDTTGANKVLLDMNLLETLRTNPIFLGSKAKRNLERAVWNDTSFLASVDVMDYSLLVGVDEERNELVVGIIDFMRQYTWDKHLETWVKASGILGGPKNASPTIISPKQYKKRFRKAMTTYFLTVPDQWSSS